MREIKFWGYRINNKRAKYFESELNEGRLRQGWGYELSHDLRNEYIADDAVRRNKAIYEKVKKGDYLLIPNMPDGEHVTIAVATEDFDIGYTFSIDESQDYDFGHIFPAKYCTHFLRNNLHVGANIKTTLKCQSRFWNVDYCKEDIEKLINLPKNEILEGSTYANGWNSSADESFDNELFAENVYSSLSKKYQAAEWEFVLCEGFKKILPKGVMVETTSNRKEIEHGCDLFIKLPGIFDTTYIIAIQIKDYNGIVSTRVIDQINKVDSYLEKNEPNSVLVDKYIICIDADSCDNDELVKAATKQKIKLIFKKELKELLAQMAKTVIAEDALKHEF